MEDLIYSKETTVALLNKVCDKAGYTVVINSQSVVVSYGGTKWFYTHIVDALLALERVDFEDRDEEELTIPELRYFDTVKQRISDGTYKDDSEVLTTSEIRILKQGVNLVIKSLETYLNLGYSPVEAEKRGKLKSVKSLRTKLKDLYGGEKYER